MRGNQQRAESAENSLRQHRQRQIALTNSEWRKQIWFNNTSLDTGNAATGNAGVIDERETMFYDVNVCDGLTSATSAADQWTLQQNSAEGSPWQQRQVEAGDRCHSNSNLRLETRGSTCREQNAKRAARNRQHMHTFACSRYSTGGLRALSNAWAAIVALRASDSVELIAHWNVRVYVASGTERALTDRCAASVHEDATATASASLVRTRVWALEIRSKMYCTVLRDIYPTR